MESKKIIIGVMGEIGSGKDTVTGYIAKNYDAGYYRDSKSLRLILDILHLAYDRKNLGSLANALRETFGEDVIAKATHKELIKMKQSVLIADGTRRKGELAYFKQFEEYRLIYVDVDIQKRFERIKARGQKSDDIHKTFEEFQKDHENASDNQVVEMKSQADFIINNNGSIEDLYRQIDKVMIQIKKDTNLTI